MRLPAESLFFATWRDLARRPIASSSPFFTFRPRCTHGGGEVLFQQGSNYYYFSFPYAIVIICHLRESAFRGMLFAMYLLGEVPPYYFLSWHCIQ